METEGEVDDAMTRRGLVHVNTRCFIDLLLRGGLQADFIFIGLLTIINNITKSLSKARRAELVGPEVLNGTDFEENNEELVEKVYELKVGMSFNSPDEISEHYKAYGLQEGFPVMQRFCRNGNDESLRYVTFTCR
ncbi:hypothetical protein WN944_014004 [Citrus x changshan-huyou]|uniref:Uncharacterized protein n=1 Tax=Citrus x changshan-huyou TaxID=2935761 RepID=A0AAP0M4Y8_9ROSI